MKITGSHTLAAPRERVWTALHDPAVLARTLPGCQRLEVTGDGEYAVTVTAGVASIKGTYAGAVTLSDQQEPSAYRMRASGSGAPGTISADATIRLEEADSGRTRVDYDADAVVGGMIGGVGQRVLVGVTRRTAGEFFDAVERDLAGPAAVEHATDTAQVGASPTFGDVFHPPAGTRGRDTEVVNLVLAAVLGAAIALLGVLAGRRTAR